MAGEDSRREKRPKETSLEQTNNLEQIVATVVPGLQGAFVGKTASPQPPPKNEEAMLAPMPTWAVNMGLKDARGTLPWDSDQYIALLGLGGHFLEGVLDTGGGRSMLDRQTVESLGIPWTKARGAKFGSYCTPGEGFKPYLGVTAPM